MAEVGDYILIRDFVIDRQIAAAIHAGHNKIAARWESYRNMIFRVLAVNEKGSITIKDLDNHIIQLNRKSYDIYT